MSMINYVYLSVCFSTLNTGIVKLCDFGVSRQLINSTALTYCGTHAYMSPERLNDSKGYKIQSDLWSLGESCIAAIILLKRIGHEILEQVQI